MNLVEFSEQHSVFAKNQPPYTPLPAWRDKGLIITRWDGSLWERIQVLFTGKIWLRVFTYNNPIKGEEVAK